MLDTLAVEIKAEEGITFAVEKNTTVKGIWCF